MKDIILKNGEVIDPGSGLHDILDVFIQDGKIARIAKSLDEKNTMVLDATGMVVSP